MLRESTVKVNCPAAGKEVELTLTYAAMNGCGCAVDCSCVEGCCSEEAACRARGGRECELQKWLQDDLM